MTMDPNAQNKYGMTALHKACLIGDWDSVTGMLRNGADPHRVDNEGRDAVYFTRLNLKAWNRAASEALAAGGVKLAAHNPLASMSDREALDVGKDVFQKALQGEGAERGE